MAIVHFAMKSSADAPPSAMHADYITRSGKYDRMDRVHVESGNMPEFAAADARAFWRAADANERANGRTYTELQIALPRELQAEQRVALAREAAREFMGTRFAYTLAVHNPEAADQDEQPHMHLMFSERVVDATTRLLPADRFFKRNGAKKDRTWNDQAQAERLRRQWCELANRELEAAGLSDRLDPRSHADQGRVVDALLVEPKMLRRGTSEEKAARREEIAAIREAKVALAELPIEAPTLAALERADQVSATKEEKAVAEIDAWEKAELSKLEKLYALAKSAAQAVGRKLQAAVQWFEKHGLEKPLEQYRRVPFMASSHAAQYARMPAFAPTEQDAARWHESGEIIRRHLQEPRYAELKAKYPDETEERLRRVADGLTLRIALGKSQERPGRKGLSR